MHLLVIFGISIDDFQLNKDQKIACVEHCNDIISAVENKLNFLLSMITGDDPEIKRQSTA